jgi:hypothetical protein
MIGRISKLEKIVLGVALGVAVVSWGCSWDENTRARYDDWKKVVCKVITNGSAEKEKCNDAPDASTKLECYRQWDNLLRGLSAAKVAAAGAYLRCQDANLDRILQTVEKLLDTAAGLAGKKGFTGSASGGNFADRLDESPMLVDIQAFEVFRNGDIHTYEVMPGSHVQVGFDDGAVFDLYEISGQITLEVHPQGPGLLASVVDMGLLVDIDSHGTCSADGYINDDPEYPVCFPLFPGASDFVGEMRGWFDLGLVNWEEGGSADIRLNAALRAGMTQLSLSSFGSSAEVFPVGAPPSGDYIYSAVADLFALGQPASIEIHGAEPGAPVDIFASVRMSGSTGVFSGAPWDLNQNRQRPLGTAVADAEGTAVFTFVMPNRPRLVGRTFPLQAIVHESGGDRSTIAFTTDVIE